MDTSSRRHPDAHELQSLALGRLDESPAAALYDHLGGCSDCRRRLADVRSGTFLGGPRDVKGQPESPSMAVSKLTDFSRLAVQPMPVEPPPTPTLQQGLVDHPDFEIIRELGRGGMGVLYLAENRLMQRKEVLKVVSADLINGPDALERFQREIRSAASLHHTNIVTAYSAFRAGESFVFAMEYVEGYDLAQLVRGRGPLTVAHACSFVYQAALGLQYAHTKGMVHRDIKPSNLIVTREEKKAIVKVLDFGLAKITSAGQGHSSLTHAGQILGTPEYIAPEQIRNSQAADIRADVYSLGCTLYHLLAGRPPFAGDSMWALCHAHLSIDAEPLNRVRPEVPVELANIVARMMAKDPQQRFQDPQDVSQALTPFFKKASAAIESSNSNGAEAGQWTAIQMARTAVPPLPEPTANTDHPFAHSAVKACAPDAAWDSLIAARQSDRSREEKGSFAARRRSALVWLAAAVGVLVLGPLVAWRLVLTAKTPDQQSVGTVAEMPPEQEDRAPTRRYVRSSRSRPVLGPATTKAGGASRSIRASPRPQTMSAAQ